MAPRVLVHFVAIGLLLFAGYHALHPDAGASPGRIVLTDDALRQMSVAWLATSGSRRVSSCSWS